MIELMLDGMPAVVKDGSSIKLSLENVYFTKASSYTYDVELPLDISQNKRIFGFINRRDVLKESRTLSASLSVDGVRLLTGEAIITKVTGLSVCIQLLGNLSANNYGNRVKETYVDEIDMGDWYSTSYGMQGETLTGSAYPIAALYAGDALGDTILYNRFINAFYGGNAFWVAYPILNTTSGAVHNEVVFRKHEGSDGSLALRLEQPYSTPGGLYNGHPQVKMAVQPFIWVMAQKVAGYTGLTLDMSDNALYTDPFLRKIFIANANNRIECCKCLPHWTVNEWWEQVERTFGLVMEIDETTGKMKLRKRSDFYGDNTKTAYVGEVLDEYTVEVDDESEADTSVSNTGYADFESSARYRIPDNLLKKAVINHDYDSLDDMYSKMGGNVDDYDPGTIYECADGRRYIVDTADRRLIEVDMLRNRMYDSSDDIKVELKFVPVPFTTCEFKVCRRWAPGETGQDLSIDAYNRDDRVTFEIMQRPDREDSAWDVAEGELTDSRINLSEEIRALDSGEESPTSHDDITGEGIAYIAIASGDHRDIATYTNDSTYSCQCPRPFVAESRSRALNRPSATVYRDRGVSLSLTTQGDIDSLGGITTASNVRVDTTVRHCFSFISDNVPDPNDIFMIQNRRYVCEKIEVHISSSGIDKKMTGYFYPLS